MMRIRALLILGLISVLHTIGNPAWADDAWHYGPVPLNMASGKYDYPAAGPVTLDATGHYRNRLGSFTAVGIDYHQPDAQGATYDVARFMNGAVSPGWFDLDRVDGDLRLLKDAGFSVIVLRAQWGELDDTDPALFQANLAKYRRIFDLIEKHGLYAELWCAFNTIPADVLKSGALGPQGRWFLTNLPVHQRILDHYVIPLARALADRTSLITWRWEFEGLGPELEHEDPHGLKLFQTFLARKYGDVARLNQAWGAPHHYASFAEAPNHFEWAKRNGLLVDSGAAGKVADRAKTSQTAMLTDLNDWRMELRIEWLGTLNKQLRPILGGRPLSVTGLGFGWGGWYPDFMMTSLGRARRLSGMEIIGGGGAYPSPGTWQPEIRKYREGCNAPFLTRPYDPIVSYAVGRHALTWGPAKASEIGMICMPLGEKAQSDYIMTQMVDAIGAGLTSADVYESVSVTCSSPEDSEPHPHQVLRDLRGLIRSLHGAVFDNQTSQSRILVLWNRADSDIGATWRQNFAQLMVAHYLYQLHAPWDVAADDLLALKDEPDKVNLNKYDLVIVPSQGRLLRAGEVKYADGSITLADTWGLLKQWIEAKKGRVLLTGPLGELDSSGQPLASLPKEAVELTGLAGPFKRQRVARPSDIYSVKENGVSSSTHKLCFTQPFGELKAGDTVTWRDFDTTLAHLAKPAGGEILARLGGPDGPPMLVRNTLANGNAVYAAGFELGPGEEGPWSNPPTLDAMTPIYEALAAEAGIKSPLGRAIPRNLGVYLSRDRSVMMFKERFDRETSGTLIRIPLALLPAEARQFTNVETVVEGEELVVRGRVPARGVLIARRPSISVDGLQAQSKWAGHWDIWFSVFNDANAPVGMIETEVWAGKPGTKEAKLLATAVADAVPVLGSQRLRVEADLPANAPMQGGQIPLYVVIDPKGKIPDLGRADNVTSISMQVQ